MKKSLIPIFASLALCAGAAGTLVVTGAFAQTETGSDARTPAMTRPMGPHRPNPAEMAARMKDMCADRYARTAGILAYVEAKLELTPAQQPLFDRWKSVKLDAAAARRSECGTHAPRMADKPPGMLDRMTREEDMLNHRLAELQAERPALEALLAALTAEQKHALGHDRHGHGHMMGNDRGMMAGGMMGPPDGDHPGMEPPPQ